MSTSASLSLLRHLMAVGALAALMFAHFSVALPPLAAEAISAATAAAAELRDSAALRNVKIAAAPQAVTRGQAVIAAVPAEARGAFIFYQLAQALNATTSNARPQPRFAIDVAAYHKETAAFRLVPVYSDFAEDLLHWTLQQFGLTATDIYGLLRANRSMYCTTNGVCYSQEDISCVCCPF